MSLIIKSISICGLQENKFIDEKYPDFSWKLASPDNGKKQLSYRLKLKSNGKLIWDSGEIFGAEQSVRYCGEALLPQTEYILDLSVNSTDGEVATKSAIFETALLCKDYSAWENAEFIGAPEYYVCKEALGVFSLNTRLTLESGDAGIIFGADDYRLLNRELNEMLIEGENFVCVSICKDSHMLSVYRVGYAPNDSKDIPLHTATVPDCNEYNLKIDCTGNCINIYVNGELTVSHLQINPLGENDVTTYPHLGNIGYRAKCGTKASFDRLECNYIREPSNTFYTLKGERFDTDKDTVIKQSPDCHALPMLRREFLVDKPIKKARLYVTARGIYECRINGEVVSDEYFAPGASHYDKHLYYQTYDVTDLISEGENAIGFTLSSGWWSGSQTFVLGCYNLWGDKESVMAYLDIEYADGSKQSVVSDTDWSYYGEGAYKFSGFFQGERVDARLLDEYDSFFKVGFNSDKLMSAVVIKPDYISEYEANPFFRKYPEMNKDEPILTGKPHAKITAVESIHAKNVSSPSDGVYIYDLGQEIAGVVKIKFSGESGKQATIRYAEMLYPDLPEYGELSGRLLVANLRDAASTDKYILSGKNGEIFSPKFTFHGFRYIEISGVTNPPKAEDVIGIQLSSIDKISGELETDNELINRFIKNVRYSQLCNFISIPTDCPQRNERMGWAGDTHVFCKTALINADLKNFYLRYLEALRDGQTDDGNLPEIAPVGGGFGGITYGSAMAFIVSDLYNFTADSDIVREYYPSMKKYMDYLFNLGLPHYGYAGPIDDWLAPEPTDSRLVWVAFYGRDCALMKKFASLLGYTDDEKFYSQKESQAKEYFNSVFFNADGISLCEDGHICDSLGSYAISLGFGMTDERHTLSARKRLGEKVRESGYRITTGFFGTGLVNPMLSEAGHTLDAYKMMTSTEFPSWLYPVTQGATTVWERWDSYTHERGFGGNNSMNSFNHYSLGSVLSWLYEYALGIRQKDGNAGYKHILISPDYAGFKRISGGFETPLGRVACRYEIIGDSLTLECDIPIGATAEVILPDRHECIGSGHYIFTSEVKL